MIALSLLVNMGDNYSGIEPAIAVDRDRPDGFSPGALGSDY